MATPVDGYIDDAGNFIPEEFAGEDDFPTSGEVNRASVSRYKRRYAAQKQRTAMLTRELNAAQARLRGLQQRLKATKNPKARQNLTDQIRAAQAVTKRLTASKASGLAAQRAAANKVYESAGQYERLLTGQSRDAFLAVSALFENYGLGSLAGKIYNYVKSGYSADTISLLLQDTKEYKQRFAGNEARKKAGLPVLSPAEYLATEAAYRQVFESAGMPKGFYDSPSDFANWIGKNVSASEIQSRVDLAQQATVLANPNYKKALNVIGIDDSQLAAYFLDPKRALPLLQKSAATAAVGAEAIGQQLTFDKSYAEELALQGVTGEQARTGYAQIASELQTMETLGKVYGEEWTQRTSEQAVFQGSAEALRKRGRLLSAERGAFTGAAGGARAGLGQAGGAR